MEMSKSNNYKVLRNEKFGRYMVAAKNIKAGELILSEKPVMVGTQINGSLICFNCCKAVRECGYVFCHKCKVAILCSPKCIGKLHIDEECNSLKALDIKGEVLAENYQVTFPLRCILLRNYKPAEWDKILQLEHHLESRRNTTVWRRHKIAVDDVLRKYGVVTKEDIETELIQRVCGVLDVNTFEVRPPQNTIPVITNPEKQCLRGLYLSAALMAHNCTGNTFLSVDDDFVLTVKAGVDVPEGQPIFFNYANVLHGSFDRRQHLREGKYFDCFCTRCIDSTELGTELSTLRCHRCRKGFIRLKNPEDLESDWECFVCKRLFRRWLIKTTVLEGRRRLEEIDPTSIQEQEMVLKKLQQVFHPNHYLILELQQNMIGTYMRLPPTKKNLKGKISLCQNLMNVFPIIEPGISRINAIALYQIQSSMVDLAHKRYQDKEINLRQLVVMLSDAERKLKEAVKYLLYEPPKSPEGRIAQVALSELKMLRMSINNIQKDILLAEVENDKLVKSKRKGKGNKEGMSQQSENGDEILKGKVNSRR